MKTDLPYQVSELAKGSASESERMEWNQFVFSNSGNYCHLNEWQPILENTYHLNTFFLRIMNAGKLIGIVPIAVIRYPLKKKAISLPYCNYGGLLVAIGEDRSRVLEAILCYLNCHGISDIEMRELDPKLSHVTECTLVLELPELPELLWKSIGDKVRNQIRKAMRGGLQVRWGVDQVDDLYEIYAANMGRLGTPVHPRKFVDEILIAFGSRADVLTIRMGEIVIAAMLVIKNAEVWIDPIASSRFEYKNLNPNMLLYWEALNQAIRAGARKFDFGRSKIHSGTYKFKMQWGAAPVSLDYCRYIDGLRVESKSTDAYRGKKGELFAAVWSRLPQFLQYYFGPKIRKFIP